MKHQKKFIVGISVVALFLIVAIGVTYSLWSKTFVQSGENKLVSDCFHIVFEEKENSGITLENSIPILDKEGKKSKPYEFSISNQCSEPVEYQLNFETLNSTNLKSEYVKFMFQDRVPVLLTSFEPTEVTLKNGKSSYKLEQGYLDAEETKNYKIRLWVDERVTQNDEGAMNANLEGKVTIKASYLTKYVEPILNGTDPVLKEGLIPVVIADNGMVRKAYENEVWYKYADKRWANAVILNDESVSYQSGEEIPESNIESYFVWIPRYRYQIFDENAGSYVGQNQELLVDNQLPSKAQEIKVVFENKDQPIQEGSLYGQWLTHPAFTSFDANGIWVGKFETGYQGSTDKVSSEHNTNEPEKVQIKPNVNSWRSIQVANAFYTTYDYKRDMDSHMMKNTEWGAVAYLQHSKYGSMQSVRINNHENYITGYSSVKEPTCGYTGMNEECNRYGTESDVTQPWNTSVGYLASTTANISGVYDMSGGALEYVMGVLVDQNGNIINGSNSDFHSGFNGKFGCPTCEGGNPSITELTTGIAFPTDTKYYDQYTYIEDYNIYSQRILGDATGEMGPFATATYGSQKKRIGSWYGDESWFIWHNGPWFLRGGYWFSGSGAGIFTYNHTHGSWGTGYSFRIVLAI